MVLYSYRKSFKCIVWVFYIRKNRIRRILIVFWKGEVIVDKKVICGIVSLGVLVVTAGIVTTTIVIKNKKETKIEDKTA